MNYDRYANGIVALHIAWTIFIFAGAIVMFFWHSYAIPEIVVISFTLLISLPFGAVCPLTLLEGKLRKKVDPSYDNHGSYLWIYINKFFGSHLSVRAINITVSFLYVFIYAAGVYFIVK